MAHPISRHKYRSPANYVTLVRLILTPFVVASIYFYAPSWWVFLFAFVVAFTDRLDGILARRYGTSSVGTFMDSLADKILVLGSMIMLVITGVFWWLPIALIAARELAMSAWRSQLAGQGITVPARTSGKYKMWVQSFAVGLGVVPGLVPAEHSPVAFGPTADVHWVVTGFLWLAVAFTLYSFAQYLLDARKTGDPVARDADHRASHSANE